MLKESWNIDDTVASVAVLFVRMPEDNLTGKGRQMPCVGYTAIVRDVCLILTTLSAI